MLCIDSTNTVSSKNMSRNFGITVSKHNFGMQKNQLYAYKEYKRNEIIQLQYFIFSEPCVVIHIREKYQQDAHFFS